MAGILLTEVLSTVARADVDALDQILLQDPTVASQADKRGKTALYFAAQGAGRRATDCVELLLRNKADPNATARSGRTPLICACETGNVGTFLALVGAGAHYNVQDRDGHSPMHAAAQYGHKLLVKKLLEISCHVDTRSRADWTPLHFAAKHNQLGIVVLLTSFDADVGQTTDAHETALNIAHAEGHRDVVEFLMPKTKGDLKFFGSEGVTRSLDSILLSNAPDKVMQRLTVLGRLRDVEVPTDPRYHVRQRRPLEELSAAEVSGLLAVRQMPYLSGPFLAARIDGAALVDLEPMEFGRLYGKVAAAYHRTQGQRLGEEQYHAVVWHKLRKMMAKIEAEHGVDEEEIARCVAVQSIRQMENFEDVFRALDHDGSGSLSQAELVPALDQFTAELGRELSPADIQRAFQAADTDHNDTLSMEEFKALYNQLTLRAKPVRPFRPAGDGSGGGGGGTRHPTLHRDGSFGSLFGGDGDVAAALGGNGHGGGGDGALLPKLQRRTVVVKRPPPQPFHKSHHQPAAQTKETKAKAKGKAKGKGKGKGKGKPPKKATGAGKPK